MRVLALVESTSGGGAETSLAAMAPGLIERGVQLDVAYFHERDGVKDQLVRAGATLIEVPYDGLGATSLRNVRRVVKARRPDVVHTMVFEADILGRIAARSLGIPVISSIINDSYGPEQYRRASNPRRLRAAQWADIATGQLVSRWHALTDTIADAMAPRLRIDRAKVDVVHRGRDFDQFPLRTDARRRCARQRLGLAQDATVVVATARQEPQKGLDVLLAALPRVVAEVDGEVCCVIAGREGAATPELRHLVEQNGLQDTVRFLGHRHDVADLLTASDLFAFPTRWEGFGGSVIEAMAVGCPVVCSNLPVLREVLTAPSGAELARFVTPDTPEEFAAELVRSLLADRPFGPGDEARREHVVKEFSIAKLTDEMRRLYDATSGVAFGS